MSVAPGRRGAIAFFVTFGVSLVVLAAALNVGWVVLTWRDVVPLLLGVIVFAAIITGLILNTTFLVREIRRNEQHDAFVNAVTHELKSPVTSIRLHLETLRAREERIDDTTRRAFYDVMLEDSARLQRAVDQVLRMKQAARAPLQQARIDLRAIVEQTVALGRAQLGVAADAMRCAPAAGAPDAPVEVIGDENEISSAIMNLLDNAVKYSRDRVDVDVAVTRDGPRARVSVSDGGVGLSPLEIKRIFNRFYRVPGPLTRRMRGTGLGLFIVQTVARRHGGRAYATSSGLGHGTTFYLELPAAPPSAG
jgi:two-component system sensor histidine kinase SenX3